MKLFLSIFLSLLWQTTSLAEVNSSFLGQRKSLINFEELDAKQWLDFSLWRDQREFKDTYKYWETLARVKNHRERMGRVLDCYGECRVFRDGGEHRLRHNSQILEGDEILTTNESYIWIFLLDGTMVRLSPNSSITFKEINVLPKKVFLHARFNSGNVLWLSRRSSHLKEQVLRETDVTFFPMALYEANPYTKDGAVVVQDYLFGDQDLIREQYIRVNKLITENNGFVNKITESFLVMPTVTVSGEFISMEAYVGVARENFLKIRSSKTLNYKEEFKTNVTMNLRGYVKLDRSSIAEDKWYVVETSGRELVEFNSLPAMNINEIMTKRIPSIFVARELLLRKHSKFLFEEQDENKLASTYGMRLWNETELSARKNFLWNFTTRLETSNLAVAKRYRKAILEKYGIVEKPVVHSGFFKTSLAKYILRGEINREKFYLPTLNSEKRKLWKIIHGIRSKTTTNSSLGQPPQKGTSRLDESAPKDPSF